METFDSVLMAMHILCGTVALISGLVAMTTKLVDVDHKYHVWSGRPFYWGMIGITVTALGLVLTRTNLPLFFISVFSFYQAWRGWRYAVNRKGTPTQYDRVIDWGGLIFFIVMAGFGAYAQFVLGEPFGIVPMVFGIIGGLNARGAIQVANAGGAKGKERISEHLQAMMGGLIATITAVLVVNIPRVIGYDSPWIPVFWLLPTALIVPFIAIWSRKIKGGTRRKGMSSSVE